jgi:hypothetical protein
VNGVVHASLQTVFAAALLATGLPRACFRRVSPVPQNGFIGRGGRCFSTLVK